MTTPVGQDPRSAAGVERVSKDGEYRGTFVPDEAGLYEVKAAASRRSPSSANSACTRARRPATASTSTRRCARRCCSGSRRRPAAGSSRPRMSRAARSDQLQRPRRHGRRRARPVGHADPADAPPRHHRRPSGATGGRGAWHDGADSCGRRAASRSWPGSCAPRRTAAILLVGLTRAVGMATPAAQARTVIVGVGRSSARCDTRPNRRRPKKLARRRQHHLLGRASPSTTRRRSTRPLHA